MHQWESRETTPGGIFAAVIGGFILVWVIVFVVGWLILNIEAWHFCIGIPLIAWIVLIAHIIKTV